MKKWKVVAILSLSLAVLGLSWAVAQTSKRETIKGNFTAADYIEIQQLYHRYGWALDTVLDEGKTWAECWTPDGVFDLEGVKYSGRKALAQFASDVHARTKGNNRHWYLNLVITPTPEGADGQVYVLTGPLGPMTNAGWIYGNDVIVKTAEGWRFKHRKPARAWTGSQRPLNSDLPKTTARR